MEKKLKTFVYDGVIWTKDKEDNSHFRFRGHIPSHGYIGNHEFVSDTLNYVDKLTKSDAFKAWMGCTVHGFVQNLTPIVMMDQSEKDSDGNYTLHSVSFLGAVAPHDGDYTVVDIPTRKLGNQIVYYFDFPKSSTPIVELKDMLGNSCGIDITGGHAKITKSDRAPLFNIIEGNIKITSASAGVFYISPMDIVIKHIGKSIIKFLSKHIEGLIPHLDYPSGKMEADMWNKEFYFEDDPVPDVTDADDALEAISKMISLFSGKKEIQINFRFVRSITMDGYYIHPYKVIGSDGNPNVGSLNVTTRSKNRYSLSPLNWVYPPEADLDLRDMYYWNIASRFTNMDTRVYENEFKIPYVIIERENFDPPAEMTSATTFTPIHFAEDTPSIIYYTGSKHKATKLDARRDDKIGDIYIPIKKKFFGWYKELLHYQLNGNVFELKDPFTRKWCDHFDSIVDIHIPKSLNDEELRFYIQNIENYMNERLQADSNLDYLIVQGYDLLRLPLDSSYKDTKNPRIDCMVDMVRSGELSRYTIFWGHVNTSPEQHMDRKQNHNHPTLLNGRYVVWIF